MNEWKPIETAPKNFNSWILGYAPASEFYPACVYVTTLSMKDEFLSIGDIKPTHWMPIPDPPKGSMHADADNNDQ